MVCSNIFTTFLRTVIFKYCGSPEVNGWYYITETTIQPDTIEEIIASIKGAVAVFNPADARSENVPGRNLEQEIMPDKIRLRPTLESKVDKGIIIIREKKKQSETEEMKDESDGQNLMNHFSPQVSYSFHEDEFIASLQYDAPILDYE
ncbi:MAG TPA: hypothetical protein VJI32_02855, partial [Candidatus Nanoarchaeia archaeon]|nr:hypothetical protein [Candidatus Nanoarchaeia archaeon]